MAFLITCPVCGPRDAYEFRFGGEDKGPRPPAETMAAPEAWCDFVHMNASAAGAQKEWWYHRSGCGTWFTTLRDTVTNLEVASTDREDSE